MPACEERERRKQVCEFGSNAGKARGQQRLAGDVYNAHVTQAVLAEDREDSRLM